MPSLFAQFLRERQFLFNVAPTTLEWYTHAFKWLPSESPTADELKDAVVRVEKIPCVAYLRIRSGFDSVRNDPSGPRLLGLGCDIGAEDGVHTQALRAFWGKDCHLYGGVPIKYLF